MINFIQSILKDIFIPIQKIETNSLAFVYSHKYNLELGSHVFPAIKYEQLYNQICMDDELSKLEIHHPEPCSREDLELIHTKSYLDDLFSLNLTTATRFSELPLNQSILDTFLYGVGGTILSTDLLDTYDFVFNIGGGYHHSYPDHAEGFCYLNDVAVAAKRYLMKNPNHKILIIDLDVHQGNGNSKIFQQEERVFTFSMHQDNLYPKKEISNLDIGLPDNCSDSLYLKYLDDSLSEISERHLPNLIYYLAGADPFEEDRLGSLKISKYGLISRDKKIKEFATKNNSKVVIVTAGGYARNTSDTVMIHYNTAREFYRK